MTAIIPLLAATSMRRARHHTLIFHRVLREQDPMSPGEPTADWFRQLLAMLVAHFEPISLLDALARARDGQLNGRTVSITFDDGYADNFEVALPALQAFDVPATFFVASGFLDRGRMWNDTIIESFRRMEADGPVDLPDVEPLLIDDWASRRHAAQVTIKAWKHLPPEQRQVRVDALAERVSDMPDDLMMSSEQLQRLAASRGVTIGGHTRSHPILASQSPAESQAEIEGGKADLESILQCELELFAYPNGRFGDDFGADHAHMVRAAGFKAAVATDWGVLTSDSDMFRVPRFTPWHSNLSRFAIDLARCHHNLL